MPKRKLRSRQPQRPLRIETLESRRLLAISAQEQYFVYRLNYARDNPVRYQAERGLSVDLAYVTPRQPLAVVTSLFNSAEAKVNDMTALNYFGHTSPSGLTANEQVRDFGYALPATMVVNGTTYVFPDSGNGVESLGAGYTTVDAVLEGLIVDAGVSPPGHRNHLLSITDPATAYNEVGIGYAFNSATTYDYYWAVHAASRDPSTRYVTGVVYNDADNDSRYDQGEGLSGVTVDIPAIGLSTTTNAGGGWALAVADGEYEVRAQGGSFPGTSTTPVRVSGRSEEVDFRSGRPFGQVSFDNWVNTAPTLNTAGNPTLSPVFVTPGPTPEGTLVASLIAGALSDVDPVARRGIAITGVTNSLGGVWQYFTGGSWTDLPAVSLSSAFLLRDTDQLRYLNPSSQGTATISYRGWDQTSGTAGTAANLTGGAGGTTAFSTAEETATINVLSANRSPVLNPTGNRTLPSIAEDSTSPAGTTVASILGTTATDADAGSRLGFGVSAISGTGTWQYSLNSGGTWQPIPALSTNEVLPLRDADRLRFVPATNFAGSATVTYYAWDQFLGQPGVVASRTATPPAGHQGSYSTAADTASVTVTPVNDAPTLASGQQAWLNPVAINSTFSGSGGTLVSEILGQIDSDVDAGALRGIAIINRTGSGNWWFQNNGSWQSGSTSDSFAWLLKSTDRVQYVPTSGFTGTATITFRAWDQTTGPETSGIWANLSSPDRYGGTTAYSAQTQVGTVFVGSAGIAPSLSSITRADANPVVGSTARFNVTFSESVVNVTAGDFSLQRTGTANGVVSSITGSGSSYVVTVSQITGAGNLGLSIDFTRDIRDSVGNRATTTSPGTNEQYSIVAPQIALSLSAGSVAENAGSAAVTGTVTLPAPAAANLTINLSSSDTSEATVPASITIFAGQTTGNFPIAAVDDSTLDGTQAVNISASASGYTSGSQTLSVTDYETLTLSIAPASISENGGTATATVARSNTNLGAALVVNLASNDSSEASVPSTVTIPANQSSITFSVTAVNDAVIDGTQVATIAVAAAGYGGDSRSVNVLDDDLLEVVQSTLTASGVVLDFSRDLDTGTLNLYDVADSLLGPADVTLVGTTTGTVRGSLVVDPSLRRLTFIKTGGTLTPDTYTLTVRSATNGVRDTGATLLDGDNDGAPGGNYVRSLDVSVPPANAVTLSIADFARGPQQPVNIPANIATGLPISFSEGGGITSASFQLRYDPTLLTIPNGTGATVAPGLTGASVTIDTTTTPGVAVIQFTSPTPLPAGTTRFIDLLVTVPSTAPYLSKHVLDFRNVSLNAGSISAVDDDAVHVVAYFGDTTANGTYSAQDASNLARLAVGFGSGLSAYKLLDPVIIGDLTFNGAISSQDTTRVLQRAAGITVPDIPPLPSPAVSLVAGGPDPKLTIPRDLTAGPGQSLSIPIHIDSIVDLSGTGVESADLAIYYDPRVIEVTGVVLGDLLGRSEGNWMMGARIDPLLGRIFVSVGGHSSLEGIFEGELIKLQVKVREDAPAGPVAINLAASAPYLGVATQLNEGYLTLIPAPTDAADDPIDGLLTIIDGETVSSTARMIENRLLVTGTDQSEFILVGALGNDRVRVRINNRLAGDFTTPAEVAMVAGPGNDYFYVHPKLTAGVIGSTNSHSGSNVVPTHDVQVTESPSFDFDGPQSVHSLALLQVLESLTADVDADDRGLLRRANRLRRFSA